MEKQENKARNHGIIAFVVLCIVGLFLFWPKPLHPLKDGEVYLKIGDQGFTTEVARTSEARARGLSFREELCKECAMLFVFENPGQYGFWMKDMRFPLDILWVYEGKVVHKESNVSEKRQDTLKPEVLADMVVETNPNSDTKVGDRVVLENQ